MPSQQPDIVPSEGADEVGDFQPMFVRILPRREGRIRRDYAEAYCAVRGEGHRAVLFAISVTSCSSLPLGANDSTLMACPWTVIFTVGMGAFRPFDC